MAVRGSSKKLTFTIKVTHLPKNWSENSLLRFIRSQGADNGLASHTTQIRIVRVDMEIGQPYALVNYEDESLCRMACSKLDGKKMGRNRIKAKIKGESESTTLQSFGQSQPRLNQLTATTIRQPSPNQPYSPIVPTVKVELRGASNKVLTSAGDQLFEYFSQFGRVKDKPIVRTGDPYYAYVNFSSETAATEACKTSSVNLGSIQLKVKPKGAASGAVTSFTNTVSQPRSPSAVCDESIQLRLNPSRPSLTSSESCTIKVELHGSQAGSLSGVDLQKYFEHLVGGVEAVPEIHIGNPYYAYVNFTSPKAAAKASEQKSIVLNQVRVVIKLSMKAKPTEVHTKMFTSQDSVVNKVLATVPFEDKLALFNVTVEPQTDGIQVTGNKDDVERALILLSSEADAVNSRIVKKSKQFNCCAVPSIFSIPDLFESLQEKFAVEFFVLKCSGNRSKAQRIEKDAVLVCDMVARYFTPSAPPVKADIVSDYLTSSQQKSHCSYSWSFQDDSIEFVKMSSCDSKAVEAHFQSYLKNKSGHPHVVMARVASKYVHIIGKFKYSYDFSKMTQTNTSTKKIRKIIRNDSAQGNDISGSGITVLCRGLDKHSSDALSTLEDKIKEPCTQVELEVKDDLQAEQMSKIANEYLVYVQQLPGKLSLVGDRQYIDKLSMELKLQMSTTSVKKTPSGTVCKGPGWEPQSTDIELKNVLSMSKEWNFIETRFKETLPNSQLKSIQRIQNKWLWGKYAFCRSRMCQKNGEEGVNELMLFHGSSQTAPDLIYQSEHGFDFRFGTHGLWGRGAYFAVNASYSDKYAYNCIDLGLSFRHKYNTKQLFVAYVLTGNSYAHPGDSSLDKPPIKDSSTHERYDSVNGVSGSKIYIVYDHDKSYPAYLITYR